MSENKQIEEMQEMASILTEASHLACEDIPLLPSDMTICYKIPCHRCKETRLLRYKGYRKALEVAREIIDDIEALLSIYTDNVELDGYYDIEVIGNIFDNGELLTAERSE